MSSSDSSRRTCYPLWPSHGLGLLPALVLIPVLLPLVSLGSFVPVFSLARARASARISSRVLRATGFWTALIQRLARARGNVFSID